MIRPIRTDDVHAVVKVHLASFPGFFLSFLGPRFLELFYRSFLEDSAGIRFVALDGDGGVIESVVGPIVSGGYFKRLMRQRWLAFCLASVLALLSRPWIASRLLRALWYCGDPPKGDAEALAQTSIFLDDNPRMRLEMGNNSNSIAMDYDQNTQYEKYADFVERIFINAKP